MFYKVFILIISLLLVSSCSNSNSYPTYEDLEFKDEDTCIYIASDTHYLASSYLDSNRDYDNEKFVSDGRTMNYNNILFDQLIMTVSNNKPDYFIITGDLSYNGAYESHREIASKLKTLLDLGIQPLIIPGNHDRNSLNPRDYSTKEYNIVKDTTIEEFKEIYQEFGYSNAFSYDEETSSYTYITKNNEMLLMLDTTLSRFNYELDYVFVGGQVFSINWLKENLEYAKEHNMKVISFTHHSLITHNEKFTSQYTLDNNLEILSLFKEYGVRINFSGHLHIQDISYSEGIYDICSPSILDYGNRYGIFKIGEKGMQYDSFFIDFPLDSNNTYRNYSFNLFKNKYQSKANFEAKNEKDKQLITDLAARLNTYYFDGSLFLHQELKKEKGYSLLKKTTSNLYFQSIYDSFKKNNHKLVIS